ncbi:hypothetical protein AVEN_189858-1 [Araneus ventricosus]|uniref:Uncharacterized protein n=1 Tax=Araneus ventricosus TaxID=182803 RepID=A0A4Y2ED65_ARAVE|nr:hypothetical protein AVEN_189858-1 [Araneus ventricosus]
MNHKQLETNEVSHIIEDVANLNKQLHLEAGANDVNQLLNSHSKELTFHDTSDPDHPRKQTTIAGLTEGLGSLENELQIWKIMAFHEKHILIARQRIKILACYEEILCEGKGKLARLQYNSTIIICLND